MIVTRNPYDYVPQQRTHENLQPSGIRKKIQNYSFLLTDEIGSGYSSKVYKGMDDITNEQVGIKVIDLRSLRDQTSKIMLNTQIECFREVKHRNILRYINSYFTANNCYIVTEYCSGSDLAKLLKQRGKISEKEAGDMFIQIFQGYEAFYNAGYVHRDLKPANILVAKDGTLRLADFGFCKKRTLVDRENYNVGTPIYMPRQSLAANIYNEKTDIWGLGITLYEMIYGEVPFRGRSEIQLRANIQKGVLNFSPQVPISEQLKSFISQCLDNDSFKRLGVKDVQKHAWIVKRRISALIGMSSLLDKMDDEKNIRISLPHDGVQQNKSREYFDGKENRRSASSMQKLKLCMPKKGSQVIATNRQPLIDRTSCNQSKQVINATQNKQNNPQNENKDIKSGMQEIKAMKKRKQSMQQVGIERVVSLINYFRLLFRIYEKIGAAETQISEINIKQQLRLANGAIADRIAQVFKKHLASVSDRSNQFGLGSHEWITFATSERWKVYEFVIGRYKTKYSEVIKQAETSSGQWQGAGSLFLSLWRSYKEVQVDKMLLLRERYMYTQLLWSINHLNNLDRQIKEQGWQEFSTKYTNHEQILLESFKVQMGNYYQIDTQLKEVYLALKKSIY